jgi:translation elongation factor EF-Tu-like GTPase
MIFPKDVEEVNLGQKIKMSYLLEKPLALLNGSKFIIREGIKTIAVGEITKILENAPMGDGINKAKVMFKQKR